MAAALIAVACGDSQPQVIVGGGPTRLVAMGTVTTTGRRPVVEAVVEMEARADIEGQGQSVGHIPEGGLAEGVVENIGVTFRGIGSNRRAASRRHPPPLESLRPTADIAAIERTFDRESRP